MRVAAIMSSPAVTVAAGATVRDAIERMLANSVGSVVVTDTGIEGILTRSDALRAAYHAGASLDALPVSRAMTANVITIGPDATVQRTLKTMATHDIKKLPVVEDFDLVGIVTLTDVARHQPKQVEEIRQEIESRDEWT